MSFLKKLFGGWGGGAGTGKPAAEIEHDGYLIAVTPVREGGQFRLGAVISKEIGGVRKEYRLVRADMFPSAGEAIEPAIRKAKLVIAEQGDKMFR